MNDTPRFAIIHQGALGDFLLSLPIYEGLHHLLPGARLDFFTRDDHYRLIASRPFTGKNLSFLLGTLMPFHHDELWRTAEVPSALREAKAVFLFGQAGSRAPACRLAERLERKVFWIQSFPSPGHPSSRLEHVTDFLRRQLLEKGFDLPVLPSVLVPAAADMEAVGAWIQTRFGPWTRTPVVLHPGSGGRGKIWPLRHWAELVRWVVENGGGPVVVPVGPAEEPVLEFLKEMEAMGVTLMEGASLGRLSALLRSSPCYVGNDSGVSHLAASVGTPSAVIFGPTDPAIWAPRGPHVRIFRFAWSAEENPRRLPGEETPPPHELTKWIRECLGEYPALRA